MCLLEKCLRLCQLSYIHHTYEVGEVEVLVVEEDKTYIAFRGTEASDMWAGRGWVDVIRDLRTIPWHDKRVGWSHSGFLKGARRAVKNLIIPRDKPVVVTGHSLGGGLAVNAAAILHAEGYTVEKCITFGAPRTFKKGTAEKWTKTLDVTNFSNHGDPVCDVPLYWWNWRHVNEVHTSRTPDGYGFRNHFLPTYFEAFGYEIS